MTIASIITDALRSIPAPLRRVLLVTFALVAVGLQVLQLIEVELPYDKINTVLVLLGGYLGVQSAANVPSVYDVEE